MTKTEWFRRTTWTDTDREDFFARLKRSRGSSSKAQYLRLQALHLSEAGHHAGAIELLDRMLADFPGSIDNAQGHAQKADSLARLGQTDPAIEEYRSALQRERDFPKVHTNAWLGFGWLVVEKQLTGLYGEAARNIDEFRDEGALKIPAIEYRYATIQAFLADARGEKTQAREFAKMALAEAAKNHSGLGYHPTVGLVGFERAMFEIRLKTMADS